MPIVTVKMPEKLIEELDRLAMVMGVSRSAMIKQACYEYIRRLETKYSFKDNKIRFRVKRIKLGGGE